MPLKVIHAVPLLFYPNRFRLAFQQSTTRLHSRCNVWIHTMPFRKYPGSTAESVVCHRTILQPGYLNNMQNGQASLAYSLVFCNTSSAILCVTTEPRDRAWRQQEMRRTGNSKIPLDIYESEFEILAPINTYHTRPNVITLRSW